MRDGTMTPLGAVPRNRKGGACSEMTAPKPVIPPSLMEEEEDAGNNSTLQVVDGLIGSSTHGMSADRADTGGAVAGWDDGRVLASGAAWSTMRARAPSPSVPGTQIFSSDDHTPLGGAGAESAPGRGPTQQSRCVTIQPEGSPGRVLHYNGIPIDQKTIGKITWATRLVGCNPSVIANLLYGQTHAPQIHAVLMVTKTWSPDVVQEVVSEGAAERQGHLVRSRVRHGNRFQKVAHGKSKTIVVSGGNTVRRARACDRIPTEHELTRTTTLFTESRTVPSTTQA